MTNDDRELSQQFKAEAARIVVSARTRQRRARSIWSVLTPVAIGAVVVLLALAIGRGIVDLRSSAGSAASPSPSQTALVPSPSPTTSPSTAPAELRSDFGVIVNFQTDTTGKQPALRTERDPTVLAEFASGFYRQLQGAVSVDGRRLAYWHVPSDAREGAELRVLNVATPSDQRTLVTLRMELPGQIRWSSDGNGVLYTVTDSRSGQGVVNEYSALRSVDLLTGDMRELGRVDRRWLLPLMWNRDRGTAAGIELDVNTDDYVAYQRFYASAPSQRVAIAAPLRSIIFSADGTRMASLFSATRDPGPFSIRVTDLDDSTREMVFAEDAQWPILKGLRFRPVTNEVAIWRMNTAGHSQLVLWQPQSGTRTTVDGVTDGIFRPDGSAIITGDGKVYDLPTGRTAQIDLPPGAFVNAVVRFR